jgi:hypothetical protein
MKNFKNIAGWIVVINTIITLNQLVFSRDLSEIINKTTLNYDVNEEINQIRQWKAKELSLFNQTGDEQNKIQSEFLDFFIQRKKIQKSK